MQQFLGRTESVEDMMELISRKVVRELKGVSTGHIL